MPPRSRPIDILMLVGAYPPDVSGGGLQCHTLIAALRNAVHVAVLTTTHERPLAGVDVVDGVKVHRIWVDPGDRRARANAAAQFLAAGVRLLPRSHLLHFHGVTDKTVLMVALSRLTGTRRLSKMTSVGLDDPVSLQARGARPLAWALRQAEAHVSLSPAMTDCFMRAGIPADRVHAIPNGVDGRRFRPCDGAERAALRQQLGFATDDFVTVFVGFWSGDKAPDAAVDGWLSARAALSRRSRLVCLGATRSDHVEVDPQLVTRVRARLATAGATDAVRFVERAEDVSTWLRASDVFVMPSRREGLPNALLEAMATGLPCVVSALPGVTTWLVTHDDNGWLIPPADGAAVGDALVALGQEPGRAARLGERARTTVLEHCGIDRVAAQYLELYRRLGVPAGSPR